MRSLRLVSIVALAVTGGPVAALAAPGRLDLLHSDASYVELRWTCERPSIVGVPGDDGTYRRPEVQGGIYAASPGTPDLPLVLQLVGIPVGPLPRISVETVTADEMALPDLAPAGTPKVVGTGASAHGDVSRTRVTFPATVAPAKWAEVLGDQWVRGQRMARVAIHPCRYDGARQKLQWARELTIRVDLPATQPAPRGAETRRDQADWEKVIDTLIPNATTARAWRRPRPLLADALRGSTASFSSAPTWIRVPIRETGVYIVDYFTFQNLGIDPGTIDPRTVRVFSGRNTPLPVNLLTSPPDPFMTECALRDLGDGDGVFDVTDRFLVYALAPNGWASMYDPSLSRFDYQENAHTDETWYWITWGGSFPSPPKRMAARAVPDNTSPTWANSAPHRIHYEQNNTEDFEFRSEDGWMWEDLRGRGDDRQYVLDAPTPASGDGFLQARMYSYRARNTIDERDVTLKLRGTSFAHWHWNEFDSPKQDVTGCFGGLLADGPNTFLLDAKPDSGAVDLMFTGWFDLEYDRALVADHGWLEFFSDPNPPTLPQKPDNTPACAALPSGMAYGNHAYRCAGFDAQPNQIFLFDATDQHDVVNLTGFTVQDAAGLPHHIRFSDPSVTGVRWYVAMTLDAAKPLPAGQIANLKGLRNVSNGTEYMVIYYPDFKDGAQRLANLRNERWGRNASMIVDVDDVYQEFSWGMKDPVAIRDFLVYAQENWINGSPLYVTLVGDASFDTKGYLSGSPPDFIPTYEDRYKEAAFEDAGAENNDFYPTDDFYGYLDPQDYAPPPSQPAVDVAIGRFPVSTPDQFSVMLDKLDSYLHYEMPGQWQNRILIAADDELILDPLAPREPIHTRQAEALATQRVPPAIDKVKVYLVNYPRDVFGKKPEAQAAFIDEFTRGALMTSYTGHGDQSTMAQEEVFVAQKIPNLLNEKRYTIFSTFSCTVSRWDLISGACLTELMLDYEGGGAVTTFASAGFVFPDPSSALNLQWMGEIYGTPYTIPTFARDPRPLGLAALAAKVVVGASDAFLRKNDEKYVLLGDPALEVRFGRHLVQFDRPTVTSQTTDGLLRHITGSIADSSGAVLDGTNGTTAFNGTAFVHVTELADTTGYDYLEITGQPSHISFTLDGPTAYRGEVPIVNGRFDSKFYLNEGVRAGNTARISVFALENGLGRDGSGAFDSLVVAPTISRPQTNDGTGPTIVTRFEGYDRFIDGDQIFTDHPVMLINLADSSGINLRPFPQFARLEAELDGRDRVDLVEDFSYKSGSFTQGQVRRIFSLGPGEHTVEIKAYDNVGNRSSQKTRFTIVLPGSAFDLVDRNVAVYPNPFQARADFLYRLTADADVTLKVFTITGRTIREMKAAGKMGDNVLAWDGTDSRGSPLANGTYLFKLEADRLDATGKRQEDHYVGKVVRMR